MINFFNNFLFSLFQNNKHTISHSYSLKDSYKPSHTQTHTHACTNKQAQEKNQTQKQTPLTPNPYTKTKKVEWRNYPAIYKNKNK